jgi:hypothetical protein
MKRLDLVFVVSLSFLATFVGHEVVEERKLAELRSRQTTSFGATRVSNDDGTSLDEPAAAVTEAGSADERAGNDGAADARRRLELSSAGTYIADVLAARDSAVARWPERRTNPLRVWVQPSARFTDFTPDNVPLVRQAFVDWSETTIPLSFTFVVDSALADIRVTWVDRFDEQISGKTLWAHDERWWIVDAQIQLAVHHRSGETLDSSAMRAIALHEVGHLIGLDHTGDTTSIMTPRVRVKDLSAADRATAQLLYLLPAGRISAGR